MINNDKMNFYIKWNENKFDREYIKMFLNRIDELESVFESGSHEELMFISKLLLDIPINKFIENIDEFKEFQIEDVIQFSNFEDAIDNVNMCIKYLGGRASFAELGKALYDSKKHEACNKYGENHSKTAREFSMVKIHREKTAIVENTALGEFLIGVNSETKKEIVKRLAIRNIFIQDLIFGAKDGIVSYMELAEKKLLTSTALRRKSNVKKVINMILEECDMKNNIIW